MCVCVCVYGLDLFFVFVFLSRKMPHIAVLSENQDQVRHTDDDNLLKHKHTHSKKTQKKQKHHIAACYWSSRRLGSLHVCVMEKVESSCKKLGDYLHLRGQVIAFCPLCVTPSCMSPSPPTIVHVVCPASDKKYWHDGGLKNSASKDYTKCLLSRTPRRLTGLKKLSSATLYSISSDPSQPSIAHWQFDKTDCPTMLFSFYAFCVNGEGKNNHSKATKPAAKSDSESDWESSLRNRKWQGFFRSTTWCCSADGVVEYCGQKPVDLISWLQCNQKM